MKSKRIDLGFFKTIGFWLTIGLSLAILSFYYLSRPEIYRLPRINILEIIEAKALDVRFHLRGPVKPRDDIVIVAVDEKTEDELGRWQSSGRNWLARLLDILNEAGARVVGFDLVLAEPDEGIGPEVLDALKTRYEQALPEVMTGNPDLLTYLEETKAASDYDRQLAEAIERTGNVILGVYYFWDELSAAHLTSEQQESADQLMNRTAYTIVEEDPDYPLQLSRAVGVEANLAIFSDAAQSFGHFNILADADGYVRFTHLLIEYNDQYYPSLALEVARAALAAHTPIVRAMPDSDKGIDLGEHFIPCNEDGKLLINFYGPAHTFPHYSLSDVLSGDIPPSKFGDRIVLLGVTSQVIKDLNAVPFQSERYPGVEVHATIIENLLHEDFITRPEGMSLIEAIVIFALGIMLGIIRHRKSPLWATVTALICMLLIAGTGYITFVIGRIWLNVTYPVLFLIVDYLAITSYNYFTEERQKRVIKNAFQHYVSSNVVSHLLESVDTLKLGGERRQLTAFFSDIRGFTAISEGMSPEALVEFLNEYLSEMTQIVLDHRGTVDKYMGDAIMAFYGAPVEQTDHAVQACKTAIHMILRLKELHVGWEARGLPPMKIGIGLNTGEMSVGNMGSRERFDYTIMGDNVNLASRLEGLNKYYGTSIIISQSTYQACTECQEHSWTVRELDTVQVKGKHESVTIYELIGYDTLYEQKSTLANTFCEGLGLYKQRQWNQAIALFQEALQIEPDDGPAKLYIERCTEYMQHPPPDNWDGVIVMESK